jgi:putative membrane-bound dehydrogenase-like protein
MFRKTFLSLVVSLVALWAGPLLAQEARPLKLVFLGDQGHHRPAQRFLELAPVLEPRGVHLTYTDDVNVLAADKLAQYDGVVLYANIDSITPAQADALLEYVASGKAFVPLHCATFCFRNDARIVALMGGQFKRHGGEVFGTELSGQSHPILEGYVPFRSWDETYVHHLHNDKDRTVLEYRRGGAQAEGNEREPWTWVRTHGEGRIFYTAWGHDERTWSHPGFHNLVERGIRWACGLDPRVAGSYRSDDKPAFAPPKMTTLPAGNKPFDFVDVGPKIPNYAAGRGKTLTEMQKPLEASESVKRFVTPVDFAVELYADESIFQAKPIAMNWDEQGRLWVCETVDYPHDLSEGNRGRDRVRVLEDTDGDGKADKSTVFAEGLNIPTAIAFHRGGAVVHNGTETLYLKDTDGDGKADLKQVLISDWNLGDTHGGVSNFRNGLDNWIWAMQGYNGSSPKYDGKESQPFRMGFFRFKLSQSDPPKVEQIEFIRSTTNNTWGLGISEEGLIFGSTANRAPSFHMPIPNRYYERVGGFTPDTLQMISDTHLFQPVTDRIRQVDHHGGYTAAAGHAVYTARTYPPMWWNQTAFVCGPTGKLVGAFVLQPDGAGFKSFSPINLIASDDEWSAPIMAEVGPDGNVWVIDWYNYIVQHNPTPEGFETGKGNAYLTDLRDKRHGRVYRVVYRGDKTGTRPGEAARLRHDDVDGLIAALSHPSMQVRLSAQRLLVERGQADCVDRLVKLVGDESVDEIGLNVGAIHAIQTLAGLGLLTDGSAKSDAAVAAVVGALKHPSAGVRRNAVGVLPDSPASAQAIVDAGLLKDPEPKVVLAALLAMADQSGDGLAEPLAGFVAGPQVNDRWLSDAATAAAAARSDALLITLAKRSAARELSPATLAIARRVSEHFARSRPDAGRTMRLVGAMQGANPALVGQTVEGLIAGWPADAAIAVDPAGKEVIKALFRSGDEAAKAGLIQLAELWKSDALSAERAEVVQLLTRQLEDVKLDPAERLGAANRLIAFEPSSAEVVERLIKPINALAPPLLASGLVGVIGKSSSPQAADKLVTLLADATPSVRQTIVQTLLSRPAMTAALLKGIEGGKLGVSDLSALQRQTLADHPDKELRAQARKLLASGGSNVDPNRQRLVEAKMQLTQRKGNADAGKALFAKNCANCHKYQGEGNVVGPDLTGMSVHPKAEWLVNILDPSRSVESNYRLYTVLTNDGVVINGVLAAESKTSIEMVDAQAKRQTILREDIDQLVASRKSAMPEGLEETLGDQGLVDLLEYLTTKGEYVPLPIGKVATVNTTRGMFYGRENMIERLVFPDWGVKTFKGVPFVLVDPQTSGLNAIMLHSPNGDLPPTMPKSVMLPCETGVKRIHLLGGVAGWAAQGPRDGGTSMIVRLHYVDGAKEDHSLVDGRHIADYIGKFNVPDSEFAFDLDGRQVRYLAIEPKRAEVVKFIEFVKSGGVTAPIVMAVTVQPTGDEKSSE